jgi:AraC-like DNA-binding protein
MERLLVRSAVLVSYARLATALHLDAQEVASEVGIQPEQLASPDLTVPARRAYRLMELAARRSGAADFGLRLAGDRINLSHLGTLGVLARDEPDVRSVLRRFASDMHLHTTSMQLRLTEAADMALVEMVVDPDGEREVRQSTECAIGVLCLILRHLLGEGWHPILVHLIHASMGGDAPHRTLFGCPVTFGSGANLLVMSSRDLDRSNPLHQTGLRAYTAPVPAASLAPDAMGKVTPQLVAQIIGRLLPSGACSATQVAQELGMDRRTLHRHLIYSRNSYSQSLQHARMALAEQYVAAGTMRMAEISDLLGFSSVSNFSRWFKAHAGAAPTAWRARQWQG